MRNKLIVANWKMNFTVSEALKFIAGLPREAKMELEDAEVVICPPFTALYALDEAIEGIPFQLGAQNMHWEESGPFTGEISPLFLKEMNIKYVILGHSERRQHFQETDSTINKKLALALQQKLIPIVCIGETVSDHKEGQTFEVLEGQIKKILDGQLKADLGSLVWAYEPIWAIGTGKNASPEQSQEVAQWMRKLIAKILDAPTAESMRILYGGSVSEEKARGFLKQPDIDGLLVGGASLDPKKFADIIMSAAPAQ
ncbi:MAG: triose-phosphate isomerase [Deltaproteobacteria bacterium RIFCSPLOWO2_12_FULL_44_12]|nr:MAG: triose-phosphate isomerase [Deltaproteobacteria bacterium RIFCSPHIGHO2_01_FULL_43_49]OGQ15149.1 MAG: triose-phosphate isomerase [Deltaproteobacteria bacterium RIFCSPHIGHO2_02_FULL_44_53]OGQ27230.1 MAG: triose-phosphate isomerase [Deltaproteobacteria bacterium RIFCSPHIGHO2_12_FULL_44_21]OGQ31666.1 MAG: triose-phosphate isomerase [Deltaproteobacteria bacterium RIFCSPLOWO2_01_FULL_45_74]OGQ42866.1 MAG: triose-phosphate isomerase [Deltaproteobacteria bacterium RIFCSPLOWO2_02_FULL_44_34]OGQ